MRDIKFRAWDKWLKKMRSVRSINFDAEKVEVLDGAEIPVTLALPEVALMQYTGQMDAKGKEIYEGDIFEWDYFALAVRERQVHRSPGVCWDEFRTGFDFGDSDRPSFCPRIIVGNVYENPELLEQERA